jgi:hypothetical protein
MPIMNLVKAMFINKKNIYQQSCNGEGKMLKIDTFVTEILYEYERFKKDQKCPDFGILQR